MKSRVHDMTGAARVRPAEQPRAPQAVGGVMRQARDRFPARPAGTRWAMTCASAEEVIAALDRPPFRAENVHTRWERRSGARAILHWLSGYPGESWQERWEASPASSAPERWAGQGHTWIRSAAEVRWNSVRSGLMMLAAADVLRLPLRWQFANHGGHVRALVERARDPEGFARLEEIVHPKRWASVGGGRSRLVLIRIMLAKGGGLADITAGDAFEYTAESRKAGLDKASGTLFYAWLRELGNLPPDAPVTLRNLHRVTGQLSCEQLVDRHGVACTPIRELLIDYLEERRPRLDYSSLDNLARALTRNFWTDLERHHPGIDSLDLSPGVATAWKERFRTRIRRRKLTDGTVEETVVERADRALLFIAVRAFYLDIARWAVEEPARWGPWAAPCPIREAETTDGKRVKRVKARMDQRTRERLPALEPFAKAAADYHRYRLEGLEALLAVPPGASFTVHDAVFVRTMNAAGAAARDRDGVLLHFDTAEHRAFWAWAAVEVLRHTGARIEEMLELSHHAMIQYRLPTTGEIVPLLQIAPSKTDQERVLLVSPELADVLATIIRRVRNPRTGTIPLLSAYDYEERVWNPPAPLLFQWDRSGENSRMSGEFIRKALAEVLAFLGLTDTTGQPLDFAPPRLPPHLHHRRHPLRPATPHRPGHRRPHQHQHHHGLPRHLPHRDHRSPPRLHLPPTSPAPRRGIPHPHRHRMGRLPRPLRTPQTLRRHLRPRLRNRLHPRTRLRPLLTPAPRPRSARPTGGDPRQPPRPHHRGRARRLARRDRRTSGQPRRRRGKTRPTRSRAEAQPARGPSRHADI